jgi:hypothetical protein
VVTDYFSFLLIHQVRFLTIERLFVFNGLFFN